MRVFITPFGICPLAAEKGIFALPVDWPTVKKVTVEPSGRPPGRPYQIQRAIALWPVDRAGIQRAELSARSTDPVDRRLSRKQSSLAVDRPPQQSNVHVLCTSVDRPGRPLTATVDPARSTGSLPV